MTALRLAVAILRLPSTQSVSAGSLRIPPHGLCPWGSMAHGGGLVGCTGRRTIVWSVILPSAMDGTDAQAIQAVLDGDVDRYAKLVDAYQGPALRLAFSLLGNYEDAQDAAQEAFVSAYRSLSRFRGGAKFSTWLYRIVVNECKDVYKRRARQPRAVTGVGDRGDEGDDPILFVSDPTASPSDQVANRELSGRLSRAIGTLSMKQRTAFLLHHVQGLSLEEAAAVMGCRVGTVKSHIFRATEALRSQLAPWLA